MGRREREGHLGFRVSLSLTCCLQMLHGTVMSKDKESTWTQYRDYRQLARQLLHYAHVVKNLVDIINFIPLQNNFQQCTRLHLHDDAFLPH